MRTGLVSTLAVAVLAVLSARASVREIALSDLAGSSEQIVLARVIKVEEGPPGLARLDPSMPPLKVATARVIETWKGQPGREVRYVASPSWVCDTSHAEVGEQVVFFLVRRDPRLMDIAH